MKTLLWFSLPCEIKWKLLVDMKVFSQSSHKPPFHLFSVFSFLVPKVAPGSLWPLRRAAPFTALSLYSSCSSVCNTLPSFPASETPIHSLRLSPNFTSSLKPLLEPSLLKSDDSVFYYFIIPSTSKHSGHSLNISVIFYDLFPSH